MKDMKTTTDEWLDANPDYTCPCGLYVHKTRWSPDQIHIEDCQFWCPPDAKLYGINSITMIPGDGEDPYGTMYELGTEEGVTILVGRFPDGTPVSHVLADGQKQRSDKVAERLVVFCENWSKENS